MVSMKQRLTLKIPIKPLSYNQYYRNTRTGKRVKTGSGLAYDEELGQWLDENEGYLKAFGLGVKDDEIIKITICNFKTNFYVKDGSRLNQRAGDWDNPIKVLQDKLFDRIGVDDVAVKWGEVRDIPSNDIDGVVVKVEKLPMPNFLSFNNFTIR